MVRTDLSPADRIQLLLQRMERQHIAVNCSNARSWWDVSYDEMWLLHLGLAD